MMGFTQREAIGIFIDKLIIFLSKNLIFHDRSKHIDTIYYFIRENINKREVVLKYVKSE